MVTARELYLGFDVGTQSTKALLIDLPAGAVVARSQHAYELIAGLPPGHLEQHPDTWIDAVAVTAREVLRGIEPAHVRGVGVSGQQHGLVVLDALGEVIRPAKLWCDTSTAAEARDLSRQIGRAVPTGFTASKIAWLKRHEPHNWHRVAAVLLPHDYVNFRLTGNKMMEAGDASGTGFFDPVARSFDHAAMLAIDARLPSLLPPLLAAGAAAGGLSAAGGRLLGLLPGTPVASGGGDNMMSAIGAGATRTGVVVVSLGTSGTVFAHTEASVVDPDGAIAPFCDSIGGHLPLLCVMNATGVAEEVRLAFGQSHEQLIAAAAAVAPGGDGLSWLPFLNGERVPDLPEATGTLLGLRPGLLRPGHLYRAALEGTSLNLAWGVDRMRHLGIAVGEVRLVGGAAKNALWRQILADCLGVPVVPMAETESAALGAALQAAWTVHRARDGRVTADAVAAPWARPAGEASRPDSARLAVYRALLAQFRRDVVRLYT
jgi:xylulokinase